MSVQQKLVKWNSWGGISITLWLVISSQHTQEVTGWDVVSEKNNTSTCVYLKVTAHPHTLRKYNLLYFNLGLSRDGVIGENLSPVLGVH